MLTQKIYHRDTDAQRNALATNYTNNKNFAQLYSCNLCNSWQKILFALCLCVSALNLSCGSKPADLRAMMPGDSLVYLESNDLGAVMKTITDRPAFREAAKSVPDFSALNGVKLAVAVTGFETKEEPVTDESSNLKFIPHFVAAIETNAWNFQANSFTENQLGEFVNHVYGGEVVLESYTKNDGRFYEWKTTDGRKAYALVQGSVIFFANDESSIDKCLAVKRGEAESIAKNPKITDGDRLAFGYVSPDGVGQIASLIGIYAGMEAGEETEVKTFIATVLPDILRNSVKEISWAASQTASDLEDSYSITLNPDVARVFSETMRPAERADREILRFIPLAIGSTTRYDLKEPQTAWRSMVLTASTQTTAINGKLIVAFSSSLFEPYGIEDPELFLSAVGTTLQTVTEDTDPQSAVVIAKVRDVEVVKRSIVKEINLNKPAEKFGHAELWKSDDDEFGFVLVNGISIMGELSVVRKCMEAGASNENAAAALFYSEFPKEGIQMATFAREPDAAAKLASVISERKDEDPTRQAPYFAETNFNAVGMSRKVRSDFGLIGWIITQFGNEG